MSDRDALETLRAQFDAAAERYDRARPSYPPELFADVSQLTSIGRGSRVLEIGPGTGQATVPLAERGCLVTAVELGANLAEVARGKLASYSGCDVVVAAFEEFPLPPEPFDLVLAATSWHWLRPDDRAAKVARALRRGGHLAIIGTHHVAGGDGQFFVDVQDCYARWDPAAVATSGLPHPDRVPPTLDEVDGSELFAEPVFRRYEQEIRYTAGDYIDVLMTYSGHLAMPDRARRGLLDCVRKLIADEYGGAIRKRYLWELKLACRA